VGLGQPIINVGAQSVQGNLALDLFLRARNFRAAETTATHDTNTFGIRAYGFLHRLFHGATKRDTLLQLFRDTAAHQISIQLGLANFDNVQAYSFLGQSLKLSTQLIDLLAITTNHNARFGGVNCHRHLVRSRALNLNARNRTVSKLLVNRIAQFEIFCEQIFVITLRVPARLPAFHDAEPETSGMYFMSQGILQSFSSRASKQSESCLKPLAGSEVLASYVGPVVRDDYRYMAEPSQDTRRTTMRTRFNALDPE
jgi:hypothetical protein